MRRPAPVPTTAPLHILLADDDVDIVRTVARALREAGHSVECAADGIEALESATARTFDLAIVDLHMPRLDGIEVVRQLKAAAPVRPVLVLSGSDDLEERIAAFDVGAEDFLEKPFYTRELLKRVDAHARSHRMTAELERLRRAAEHLRVMASEATALLAHDLNNGLAVVKANLEYLTTTVAEPIAASEETSDAASSGHRALVRMITLVRNFVDISKMEDAVLRPSRGECDVAEIVRTVAEIHLPRRSGSAIALDLDAPQGLRATVDATLLERILHNLLNNASRYVNRGGTIRVAGRLERDNAAGEVLVLSIANSGPAIPEPIRARLFDKYATGRDRLAQSGMGLYFCRLATEAHGGTIALVPLPGYDVNIEVRLPCGAASAERVDDADHRARIAS